ncbi:MAG: hypothetical protein SF182_12105 [Deltaproteobacteria bacterium]|nr:hypothetical protein [Deltaproteobacteria bacterium]
MSLSARVIAHLERAGVPCAVIGGVALGAHGIARATLDTDVLVTDPTVLSAAFWPRRKTVPTPMIRRGAADDPLVGVASLRTDGEQVDVVVGRGAWMAAMLTRRIWAGTGRSKLPIVDRADLVLLKLYAAGPQDLLDVRLLLQADRSALRRAVESRLPAAPRRLATVWRQLDD